MYIHTCDYILLMMTIMYYIIHMCIYTINDYTHMIILYICIMLCSYITLCYPRGRHHGQAALELPPALAHGRYTHVCMYYTHVFRYTYVFRYMSNIYIYIYIYVSV